jgi:hypothetical protein
MDDENTMSWAETVTALMSAAPDEVRDGFQLLDLTAPPVRVELAEKLATALGRAGYALVRTGTRDDFHARAAD